MSEHKEGKWGTSPTILDLIEAQKSFAFTSAAFHHEQALMSVKESCRVVMLFGVGGLLGVSAIFQADLIECRILLALPALLFAAVAGTGFWASYHLLAMYHAGARDVFTTSHREYQNWMMDVAGALRKDDPKAIFEVRDPPNPSTSQISCSKPLKIGETGQL